MGAVHHFNRPGEMQGAGGFLLGGRNTESVSIFPDPQRMNVQVIQAAYVKIGLNPSKRDIFPRLLRQVHSP